MQSRKRRNPLSLTDVTRKLQNKLFDYLSVSLSDSEIAAGVSIDKLVCDFPDVADFRRVYLAYECMSKYPNLDLAIDREAVAVRAFAASEERCLDTNIRLQWCSKVYGVDAVISTARRLLCSLLGKFDLNEMNDYMSFTGGASTRLSRRSSLPPMKYSGGKKLHVTQLCLPYALAAIKSSYIWSELLIQQNGSVMDSLQIVPGNRITTVPKNAKTDRVIAIEPDLNMYVQKGIGGMIRRRLRKVGVNLNSQVKNQTLAAEGSKIGSLATIDLRAASDTISIELVRLLCPDDWFGHIMATRSPRGTLPDGSSITYQKVSSMGNGYTFELESAIFWALSRATIMCTGAKERRLAIFGDDIVIDSSCVDLLKEVFSYSGFEFNMSKSFWSGPFRESCGKHFVNGIDVTPFYIRRPIDSVPRLFWFCNQFRRWASAPLGFGGKASFELWRSARNHIPKKWQLVIPDGYGDIGLLGTLSERNRRTKRFAGLVPKAYQYAPGSLLMYIYTLDSIRSRTAPAEECSTLDSELLSKVVPDRYKLNRYRPLGWADPAPWISDLEGPVGLV